MRKARGCGQGAGGFQARISAPEVGGEFRQDVGGEKLKPKSGIDCRCRIRSASTDDRFSFAIRSASRVNLIRERN
jgi:hypothetical protein